MSLIRLALGRRHRHRHLLRLVPEQQAPSRFRGALVALDSNAMLSPIAGAAKISPSISKNSDMVSGSHFIPHTLADNAKNSGVPVMSHSVGFSGSQIILGGLYRLLSTKSSGSPNPHDCPEDDIVDQLYECPVDRIVDQLAQKVTIGDNLGLKNKIESEENRAKSNILGFQARYFAFVKPMLASRCLIAPADLNDPSTVFLHRQTYNIVKYYPRYLSIFDVMTYEDGVRDFAEWILFLDHLTKKRIYIIEDKNMKLSISSIETLFYDHGIIGPNDGIDEFYKGECDASFVKNSAILSYIIWKGDKIISSEIYQAKTYVDDSFGTSSSSVFFVGVEEKYKLDCLIGIKQSIGPNKLVLYVNNIEDKPPGFIVDLKKIIGKLDEKKSGCCSRFAELNPQDDFKTLVVVFDAVISAEVYYDDAAFHVLFVTDKEMEIINENNIPELTALAFVYFNGVKFPLNDPVKKINGDQTKKGKEVEEKVLSVAEVDDEGARYES